MHVGELTGRPITLGLRTKKNKKNMAEVKYLKRKMAITFKLLWIFMSKIFLVMAFLLVTNCDATDLYDGKSLTIPQVFYKDTIYTNVVVSIGNVVSVGSGENSSLMDFFDESSGQLFISSVSFSGNIYNNVVVTVANIQSIGGSQSNQSATRMIVNSSKNSYTRYFSQLRNPNVKLTTYFQPGSNPVWQNWIPKGMNLVAQAIDSSLTYVNGMVALDEKWGANILQQNFNVVTNSQAISILNLSNPYKTINYAPFFMSVWNDAEATQTNSIVKDPVGMRQTPAHEVFHSVQTALANGPTTVSTIPTWFKEGHCVYIGTYSSDYLGFNSYLTDSRPWAIQRAKAVKTPNYPLSEIVGYGADYDSYGIGEIATEFLIGLFGIEKSLNIYREMAKGLNFNDSFQKAIGINIKTFYSIFEANRQTLLLAVN